jgi:bacterioferritin-associated ferredoxin
MVPITSLQPENPMYVCICNGVTDRDIQAAASRGARTVKDLRRELGVASDCGKCASCAHELLCEARRDTAPAARLQAA